MGPPGASVSLQLAGPGDLSVLLPLVRGYHDFEQVTMGEDERRRAVEPLLQEASTLGCIWLIRSAGATAGYLALCFGYSIEFQGRDAFIDELYLVPAARGQGIGSAALGLVRVEAAARGIVALHLEVARDNDRARRLYQKWGFTSRETFHLMSCRLA